jgi:hypothetical protein
MHNTLPRDGEPCWQCANPFILQAYVEGKRDGLREVINRVLDPHQRKSEKMSRLNEAQAVLRELSEELPNLG